MDGEVAAVMSAGEEVVECLCGLNTSGEKPLAEIAAAFSKYVTAAYFDVRGRLQTVWLAFFDIVGETPPEDQQRLVDFVLELRKTTAENFSGHAIFHEIDGHLWHDLPGLTRAARDYWNFSNVPPFTIIHRCIHSCSLDGLMCCIYVRNHLGGPFMVHWLDY